MQNETADPAVTLERLLAGVATVFESFGRALVALGPDFRVLYASPALERLAGGPVEAVGASAEELLGELFEAGGGLRRALAAGESREGWGASLHGPGGVRQVSVSAAPLAGSLAGAGEPRVAYVVGLRPVDEDEATRTGAPVLFSGLLARSSRMLRLFRSIENLAGSEATVLLCGESGTGKELVARAIHAHSPRRQGPFVAVHGDTLSAELFARDLFGHVRGAFAGAVGDHPGGLEAAARGTLFLAEVGDLPLPFQARLLRVLQDRTFERWGELPGEGTSRRSEARILAATSLDLKQEVAEGRLRDDLYQRLRVIAVEIPPLRERRADVEPLARHLLDRVGRRHGRALHLAPDAMRILLSYRWPGNVSELEDVLEVAVAVCPGQTIRASDLPSEVIAGAALPLTALGHSSPDSPWPVEDPERTRLRLALDAHRWRRDETAQSLGMSRTTLWRKMREMGLVAPPG